jgi:hypothetical protein
MVSIRFVSLLRISVKAVEALLVFHTFESRGSTYMLGLVWQSLSHSVRYVVTLHSIWSPRLTAGAYFS